MGFREETAMDQALVQSGFDAEVALGPRYLQYLMLLAVDTGIIQAETTIGEPPVRVIVQLPDDVDRTYQLDPLAPPGEVSKQGDAFAVEVLLGHPSGADLRVNLRLHLLRQSDGMEASGVTLVLFVRLGLRTERDADGVGLASVALHIELVDVDGGVVPIAATQGVTKDDLLAALKAAVDRTVDLGGVGEGAQLQEIGLRKLAADGTAPAALGLYLNLKLRDGPQPDRFLAPRGDMTLARNILPADADIAFAAPRRLYKDFANDAFFRRAVPSGSGFDFPIRRDGKRIGKITEISAGPDSVINQLDITVHAEYDIDILPDPGFVIEIGLRSSVDGEGVMKFGSVGEVKAGVFSDVLFGVISAALIPVIGFWSVAVFSGLELALVEAENIIGRLVVDELVEKRVDATLLDIAPTRLTILRRRWDPFYATHHQIGLRPGGMLFTDDGVALWGRPVLTRATDLVRTAVIREAERDGEGAPLGLRYRVDDIVPFRDQLALLAPGADREAFEPIDLEGDPGLFQIGVGDAIDRLERRHLVGAVPYLVEAKKPSQNTIRTFLVISEREADQQRDRLVEERTAALTEQITRDHEPEIRDQVNAEFKAQGMIPTPEQVEAEVAERLEVRIDAAVNDYVTNALARDLKAALRPLLRFELAPTDFGRLQDQGILILRSPVAEDLDLVHRRKTDRFYYRDHYVRAEETTLARREADNLRNLPQYRSTPAGPDFV
jgi:hypothetical protein